jgi:hypothetical protein
MDVYKYYKKEKDLRTFNSVKYYVISLVLDILAQRMALNSIANANEVELPLNKLMQEIGKYSTFDMEWTLSKVRVELIVAEMSWMNLITSGTRENPDIRLTDEGFAAYKDQRFHTIAASLMEAKENRRLGIIAVVVSLVTLLVTIVSIWCH